MAKRIQMRKQRFNAFQKLAQEKKLQLESHQSQMNVGGSGSVGGMGGGGMGGGGGGGCSGPVWIIFSNNN